MSPLGGWKVPVCLKAYPFYRQKERLDGFMEGHYMADQK